MTLLSWISLATATALIQCTRSQEPITWASTVQAFPEAKSLAVYCDAINLGAGDCASKFFIDTGDASKVPSPVALAAAAECIQQSGLANVQSLEAIFNVDLDSLSRYASGVNTRPPKYMFWTPDGHGGSWRQRYTIEDLNKAGEIALADFSKKEPLWAVALQVAAKKLPPKYSSIFTAIEAPGMLLMKNLVIWRAKSAPWTVGVRPSAICYQHGSCVGVDGKVLENVVSGDDASVPSIAEREDDELHHGGGDIPGDPTPPREPPISIPHNTPGTGGSSGGTGGSGGGTAGSGGQTGDRPSAGTGSRPSGGTGNPPAGGTGDPPPPPPDPPEPDFGGPTLTIIKALPETPVIQDLAAKTALQTCSERMEREIWAEIGTMRIDPNGLDSDLGIAPDWLLAHGFCDTEAYGLSFCSKWKQERDSEPLPPDAALVLEENQNLVSACPANFVTPPDCWTMKQQLLSRYAMPDYAETAVRQAFQMGKPVSQLPRIPLGNLVGVGGDGVVGSGGIGSGPHASPQLTGGFFKPPPILLPFDHAPKSSFRRVSAAGELCLTPPPVAPPAPTWGGLVAMFCQLVSLSVKSVQSSAKGEL